MLTNGEIKEIDLLKTFRKMGDISTAEEILGPGWTNKTVKFADTLKNGPILVEMREISIGSGHHLVVDSVINNVVSIRDPWEGTRYTMSFAEFDANWTGQALYRK